MKKQLTQTSYIFLLLFLIFISSQTFATSDSTTDNAFNYSQTVALILKTENGGYIFQRPERDDPVTAFVPAFAITCKYAAQMHPIHSGLALDRESLQPQHTFLLINNQSTKLLYLGDHWLGDESSFAIMETDDYQNLKHIFESRMQVSKPTPEEAQQSYIQGIHELWQEDSEEFYRRYYFPERNALQKASSTSSNNSPLPARSFTQESSISQSSTSETMEEIKDSTRSASSVKNSEIPYEGFQTDTDSNIDTHTDEIDNLYKILLMVFILILTATYWWWRKHK